MTPDIIWCVVCKNYESGEVVVFTEKTAFNYWLWNRPEETYFIGHNIVSFDVPVLNLLWNCGIDFSRCIDTLVLSYLYKPALEDGHSLEAWGLRLKFFKGDFSDWSKLSDEMISYCQQDVELTYRVYNALSKKMKDYGYSELSCDIEHKIRIIIDEQQRNGFWFDKIRAVEFRDFLKQTQSLLAEQIQKLFPPELKQVCRYPFRRTKDGSPFASYEKHLQKYDAIKHIFEDNIEYYECYEYEEFNLNSPKQRVEKLLSVGWEPQKFTKPSKTHPKGFPQVDEEALLSFSALSKKPEITALAEYLVLQGRASMLDTWLNNLGSDSRIHGKIMTCGASTRRMTHSAPNTANIPSGAKAKYGHECRSFWAVTPGSGNVLVGYDAAGLETAGLCHYLRNQKATEVLLRPKPNDVHTVNAVHLSGALGWPVDRERGAKTSWYAWLYGAYPKKLGSIVSALKHGMSEEAAGEIVIDTFFRNVPGLKELISSVQDEFRRNNGRLETIDGGFVFAPSLGAALNYKIQSLGTIVCKLAAILLDEEAKKLGIPFKKVADVHDEGQLEVEEKFAERLGKLAVWSIEEAGRRLKLNVPVSGDFKSGSNWSMTH